MPEIHHRSGAGFAAAFALALPLFAGCGGGKSDARPATETRPQPAASTSVPAPAPAVQPRAAATQPATPAEAAAEIFVSRCTTCHGATGKGDGPGSLGLVPQPRDLTDVAWQESVSDEYLERIIAYGGIAVGKSAGMPPNPDLMAKKDVLVELRKKVRSLAKP